MPYFHLHSEEKNKQKDKVRLNVYMFQEMGDLYSEQKIAGAIFDLPHHHESHFSFPIGRTELE